MQRRLFVVCAPAIWMAACQFIPGTEAYRVAQAERVVAKLLIDPTSVEFQNVVVRKGFVCGELNGRNRMGAFVGFKRFLVGLDGNGAQIDPGFDYADLISAEESCNALMGNEYASLSSRVSACQRADEQRASERLQTSFDAAWTSRCSFTARPVYRPPPGDTNRTANIADVTPTDMEDGEINEDDTIEADARGGVVDENANPISVGSSLSNSQDMSAQDEGVEPAQVEQNQAFPASKPSQPN